MAGDEGCRVLYEAFTRRHARWRLIQNKRWGVALLRVADQYDDHVKGSERSHFRRELSRGLRAGFSFAPLDPLSRLDEIMDVNRSAGERQGQPMHPDYLNEAAVRRYFERSADVFGVSDSTGVLRAYLCLRRCGEVACVERLLGHADALKAGVMWVLVAGAIEELVARRQAEGRPTWFMYDTIIGAAPGLRSFKKWIGFQPYRVSWTWRR